MILTILGGGGFRVPLVYRALLNQNAATDITTVKLFDVSWDRLKAIGQVLTELAQSCPTAPKFSLHTDLTEALTDADFIFSAIRVGGLPGRELDEEIPAEFGLIGQETVGAGGICYGLRTLPVVTKIAQQVAQIAPQAWFINFTNPAGMVTEAIQNILPGKVIGICDSPIGLANRALRALGVESSAGYSPDSGIEIDYLGLNHLGWITQLKVDGRDLLPKLLSNKDLLDSFEEGRLFGAELLQTLQALPNEYLHYYYFARENLTANKHAAQTRAQQIQTQQKEFYFAENVCATGALNRWETCRLAREKTYLETNRQTAGAFDRDEKDLVGGGYEQVALAIMQAIATDQETVLILNTANGSRIDCLDPAAVIEAPCRVESSGVHPLPTSQLPDYAHGLVARVKYVERCAIRAAETGSRKLAWQAIAAHPLVDSVKIAKQLLDKMINLQPGLRYLH